MCDVIKEIVFLVRHDTARAQRRRTVDGTANVHIGAVVLPGASFQHGGDGKVLRRPLADEIHRSRRIARALEEPIGAAKDFNSIIDRQIRAQNDVLIRSVDRDAVDVNDVERKAPGREIVAAGSKALHGHAGRILQCLSQCRQLLLFDSLTGDHSDRLRHLPQRKLRLADRDGDVRARDDNFFENFFELLVAGSGPRGVSISSRLYRVYLSHPKPIPEPLSLQVLSILRRLSGS